MTGTSASHRGLFVVFEGGEGSGKSTQAELLAVRLKAGGWPVVHVREPGGTALGEELRRLILQRPHDLGPEAELLLFLASRAELVRSVIRPQLEDGGIVICDRYEASTFAYQGYGRGLDLPRLRAINDLATGGLHADLTVLLDLPVTAGLRRKDGEDDAFQREDVSFHERVRQGYLALAREGGERWLILDATREQDDLAREIAARVETLRRWPQDRDHSSLSP